MVHQNKVEGVTVDNVVNTVHPVPQICGIGKKGVGTGMGEGQREGQREEGDGEEDGDREGEGGGDGVGDEEGAGRRKLHLTSDKWRKNDANDSGEMEGGE